jgi:hypothetical protein
MSVTMKQTTAQTMVASISDFEIRICLGERGFSPLPTGTVDKARTDIRALLERIVESCATQKTEETSNSGLCINMKYANDPAFDLLIFSVVKKHLGITLMPYTVLFGGYATHPNRIGYCINNK